LCVKIAVLWGVTPCSLSGCCQSYEGDCCLHFRMFSALKMEATYCYEILVSVISIGRRIPEGSSSQVFDGVPSCFLLVCSRIINMPFETKLCVVLSYRHLQQAVSHCRFVTASLCWSVHLLCGRSVLLLPVRVYSYTELGLRLSLTLIWLLSLVHTLYKMSPK
jgi:hypothetical protein